jgi:hypothetical protein
VRCKLLRYSATRMSPQATAICRPRFALLPSQKHRNKNAGSGEPFHPAAQTVPGKTGKRYGPYRRVIGDDLPTRPIGRERRRMLTGDGLATTVRPDLSGKGHKYAGESLSLVGSRKGWVAYPYRRAERAKLWVND